VRACVPIFLFYFPWVCSSVVLFWNETHPLIRQQKKRTATKKKGCSIASLFLHHQVIQPADCEIGLFPSFFLLVKHHQWFYFFAKRRSSVGVIDSFIGRNRGVEF